jgi:hypothetical protein
MPIVRSRAQAKGTSVVIAPHEPRTKRAVRNVTHWKEEARYGDYCPAVIATNGVILI